MKLRTKNFAVRIINLVDALPYKKICWDVGRQLLRSGTSVGANYRAACRARSNAEFKSRLGVVEEEADETLYWMELLIESGVVKATQLQPLMVEADEILRIVVSAIKNTPASANNRKNSHFESSSTAENLTQNSAIRIPNYPHVPSRTQS